MLRIKRNRVLFAISETLLSCFWKDFKKEYRTSFLRVSKILIVQVYRYLSLQLRCTYIEWS